MRNIISMHAVLALVLCPCIMEASQQKWQEEMYPQKQKLQKGERATAVSLRFENTLAEPVAVIVETFEPVCLIPDQSFLGTRIGVVDDPEDIRVTARKRVVIVPARGFADVVSYKSTEEHFYLGKTVQDPQNPEGVLQDFLAVSRAWQGPYVCTPLAHIPGKPIVIAITSATYNDGLQNASLLLDADRGLIARESVVPRLAVQCRRVVGGSYRSERLPVQPKTLGAL